MDRCSTAPDFPEGRVIPAVSRFPKAADAVVIGGGALGTSICLRLARAGLRTVLCERKGLAAGCTGTTVALVNASSKGPPAHYTSFNLRSAQLYRDLGGGPGGRYRL